MAATNLEGRCFATCARPSFSSLRARARRPLSRRKKMASPSCGASAPIWRRTRNLHDRRGSQERLQRNVPTVLFPSPLHGMPRGAGHDASTELFRELPLPSLRVGGMWATCVRPLIATMAKESGTIIQVCNMRHCPTCCLTPRRARCCASVLPVRVSFRAMVEHGANPAELPNSVKLRPTSAQAWQSSESCCHQHRPTFVDVG